MKFLICILIFVSIPALSWAEDINVIVEKIKQGEYVEVPIKIAYHVILKARILKEEDLKKFLIEGRRKLLWQSYSPSVFIDKNELENCKNDNLPEKYCIFLARYETQNVSMVESKADIFMDRLYSKRNFKLAKYTIVKVINEMLYHNENKQDLEKVTMLIRGREKIFDIKMDDVFYNPHATTYYDEKRVGMRSWCGFDLR